MIINQVRGKLNSDSSSDLMVCNAVWAGRQIGPIHAACLNSFLRVGHPVHLHVYEPVTDAPKGVVQVDANLLLPWSRVERYVKVKRFDILSDAFRYHILEAELGCYIDCDVYCLRPLETSDFILAWEDVNLVNGAILMLPSNSQILADLARLLDSKQIPDWVGSFSARNRLKYYIKRYLGRPRLASFGWGVIGPDALTWFVKKYGLEHSVLPADYFYPVHFRRVRDLLDPELTIDDLITHRTRCVHLYNECLRKEIVGKIPQTSPLGQMLTAEACIS